jgi:polyhydroxyalkanoate synthesis regulator phasin
MPGVKETRKMKLPLANRAQAARNTRRNAKASVHRGHVSQSGHPIFKSYHSRVVNATRKASNKANKNAERHIKLDKSVGKLRVINNKIRNALKIYDAKVEQGEVSDDIIDAVSIFLSSIKDALDESDLDLDINEENPADYVDELTKYIKRNLIDNYNNGKSIDKKVKEAVYILNVFRDSVKENEEGARELDIQMADVEMNND